MINTQEERDALDELLGRLGGLSGLSSPALSMLVKIAARLEEQRKGFDRSLRPDCAYEPIAAWVNYELDAEGRIVSVTPCEGPQSPDDPVGQLCLVYSNSYAEGVTPYDGTWDGVVEDYHRDAGMQREWWFVREPVFGTRARQSPDRSLRWPLRRRRLQK